MYFVHTISKLCFEIYCESHTLEKLLKMQTKKESMDGQIYYVQCNVYLEVCVLEMLYDRVREVSEVITRPHALWFDLV